MTREEKANELAQKYFPDANNIWERANLEAIATEIIDNSNLKFEDEE